MNKNLKAFVRMDGSGRSVPSSLILRQNKPKLGKWLEVETYKCCSSTVIPQCATYGIVLNDELAYLSYNDCDGTPRGPFTLNGPMADTFCCAEGSIILEGNAEITLLEYGCTNTTTTTELPR